MCLCMCAVKGNGESAVYNTDTDSHAGMKKKKSVDAAARRMTPPAGQHFSSTQEPPDRGGVTSTLPTGICSKNSIRASSASLNLNFVSFVVI